MAKKLAVVFGVIFVLVGLLGLIGGVGIVGPMGIFETNLAHDLVHLLVGIVLLAVAMMSPASSGLWLKIFGVVYLAVAVVGYLTAGESGEILGIIHANTADHVLHVVLGIVLFLAGHLSEGSSMPASPVQPMGGTM